jgi:iron complex transport system substrate-binding protein
MIRIAGGVNAVAQADGAPGPWPQLSLEAIVDLDPDIIVGALEGHGEAQEHLLQVLRERSGWRELSAVRQGRVYPVNPDLTVRTGPRIMGGLELLAEIIQGQVEEGDG